MRIRTLVVPLAMLVSIALIAPGATAAIQYKTSKAYFTCADGMPVQNVQKEALRVFPSWSNEKPGDLSSGGACAQYGNMGLHLYFTGSQKGPINSITVELHNAYVSRSRGHLFPMPLDINLEVDGVSRVAAYPIEFTPAASKTGLTEVIRFTITGLHVEGAGTHRIALGVSHSWENQSVWVWGAEEVPSGLTFNPRTAQAVRIPAW